MGLRNLQIRKIAREIILKKLKSGIRPNPRNLENLIREYFNENNFKPGLPSLNKRKAKRRSTISSSDYNKIIKEIERDLELIYENIINQNEKLIDSFNEFSSNIENIKNTIENYRERTESILTVVSNTNPHVYTCVEDFGNIKNTDLTNTDAFIDLNNKNVKLPIMQGLSKSVELDHVQLIDVYPSQEIKSRRSLSNINNVIDGFINNTWQYKIELDEQKEKQEMNVELEIQFDGKEEFSNVQLTQSSTAKTYISAYYRDLDSNEWNPINKIQNEPITNKKSWNLPTIETKRIKLKLTKNKPDSADQKYVFGIANILLSQNYYEEKATYESEVIEVGKNMDNFVIDKAILEVKDDIPEDCNIKYYLQHGTDPNSLFGKRRLEPKREDENNEFDTLDLGLLKRKQFEVSSDELVKENDYNKGFTLYHNPNTSLIEYPVLKDTIEIYHGNKLWKKEVYQDLTEKNVEADRRAKMSDWNQIPENSNVITEYIGDDDLSRARETDYDRKRIYEEVETIGDNKTFYISCENIENLIIEDKSLNIDEKDCKNGEFVLEEEYEDKFKVSYKANSVFYKFSTWMYFDEPEDYTTALIDLPSHGSRDIQREGFHNQIFLNNHSVYKRFNRDANKNQYEYRLPFKKGWNHIIIIAYIHDYDKFDIKLGGFDAETVGCSEYRIHKSPMKKVDVYRLQHQINPTKDDYYALDDEIIEMDGESTTRTRILFNNTRKNNYIINFKYPFERNIDNNNYYIKLIAELETEDEFETPRIHEIKTNFFY